MAEMNDLFEAVDAVLVANRTALLNGGGAWQRHTLPAIDNLHKVRRQMIAPPKAPGFRDDLTALINSHSKENGSNTPDFLLADYLMAVLETFDRTVQNREAWYGRGTKEAA